MDTVIQRIIVLNVFVMVFILLSSGCGPSSYVTLTYPRGEITLPRVGAPSIAVVLFHDQRATQGKNIGIRSNGSKFTCSSSVSEWISKSLAKELFNQGFQVSYARTLAQSKIAKPEYIVTGAVQEVWVTEENPTSFSAVIGIKVTLSNNEGILYSENFNFTQEKLSLPMGSQVELLLATSLQSLLESVAKKIHDEIH